jgi:hypothetical protein
VHITFVKKVLADGAPCAKCAQVEHRLHESGHMASIDAVIIADERDPASPGMQIAQTHDVDRAPFFVVDDAGTIRIYTVYFKFVNEVLGRPTSKKAENQELLRDNPQLDFI